MRRRHRHPARAGTIPFDATWGSLQVAGDRGAPPIPLGGGTGDSVGNANALASRAPVDNTDRYRPITYGSSHIQADLVPGRRPGRRPDDPHLRPVRGPGLALVAGPDPDVLEGQVGVVPVHACRRSPSSWSGRSGSSGAEPGSEPWYTCHGPGPDGRRREQALVSLGWRRTRVTRTPSRCSSCPTAPASAPRRWATRCSSSSRTCASSGTLFPFITTVEEAQRVVAILDEAMDGPGDAAGVHHRRRGHRAARAGEDPGADHRLLRHPHAAGSRRSSARARPARGRPAARRRRHPRYNTRMAAVEFTIEHDDGQSVRRLEKADVILHRAVALRQDADEHVPRAPARPVRRQLPAGRRGPRARPTCPGRSASTPTRCVGLTTTVERLSRVRNERRPGLALRLRRAVPLGAAPRAASCTPPTGSRSSTPRRGRSRRWPP